MNDNYDDRDAKAAAKTGWVVGAAFSNNPLMGLLFAALPFLFPRAADRLAGKVSAKFSAMLYPAPERLAPTPAPAPMTLANSGRFLLFLLAIMSVIAGGALLAQLVG